MTRADPPGRPRFVILVWGLVPGGTLAVLRQWLPQLRTYGDVNVVSLGPNDASLGVPTVEIGARRSHPYRFPNALPYVVRMALAAARRGRGGHPTVLLPQDALATGAAAVLAATMGGAAVAVMEHGTAAAMATEDFWRERSGPGLVAAVRRALARACLGLLHRAVLRRMNIALVAGDEAVAVYRSRGVDAGRLLRYRFGVDLDRFRPSSREERSEARRRWGVAGERRVVVSVARLAPEKGVADLLTALGGLPHAVAPRLIVAGDGPQRTALEAGATAAGLDAIFVGHLEPDDVASVLRAADCFAYAGRRGANTPFAVLEAMASGLPVVATTAPRVHREMLADGRGIAVEPASPDALRDALLAMLSDPARAATAGSAARRYVERNHAPDEAERAVSALAARLGLAASPPGRTPGRSAQEPRATGARRP